MENTKWTSEEVLERLREGNERYLTAQQNPGDISPAVRLKTAVKGQKPCAIVITCSDSRVIPESIFSAGIGELFVIRLAGNVIDRHQLGSIEYAEHHLHCPLLLIMGHTQCGAVGAVLAHNREDEGFIRYILDDIAEATGDETDPHEACVKNVRHSIRRVEESLEIQQDEKKLGLKVVGAVYDIETGKVEFL